ncbi:hypothetical protein JWJ90_10730 [Desulfobulbus rhabdoformis]|uniref:KAP family P-loop NTPase fold protein n=1 Tax=Desulfobulbus rhabdoformis TaxID=34032 RepID=UPI0019658B7F|nr:P-loop NTPase fold protein [Desulfobulbus rhabdoformis]MBM9614758.1 hypothetical protein [Desulfobulbus rhabdoformis]
MNLKFQPIEIYTDDPFENDLLDRENEVKNLSVLLKNLNSPAVLAINSRWGTGKTTFIKMWESYLKGIGAQSLYFNAWETDFSEEPLVSFLGEMNEGLESLIGTSEKSRDAWKKTKDIGKKIAKRAIPVAVKLTTQGIVDLDKSIEDELAETTSLIAGDAFEDYTKAKNSIKEFHNSLTKLIKESSEGNPVIFFIDELDRCRPTYAIKLLERIKHLFNINGLIFVLAIDKKQLGHSISSIYGGGIDSAGYLRRFIDFEYEIKQPDKETYIRSLFSSLSMDDYFKKREKYRDLVNDKGHLLKAFSLLCECHQFSLREIEQMLASINLALRSAAENEYIHPALLAFLVVTKNVDPEEYQRYISNSEKETETINYLYSIIPEKRRLEDFECARIEGFLIAAKYGRYSEGANESLVRHKEITENEELSRKMREYSRRVLLVASDPVGMGRTIDLECLVARIEMLSQFKFSDEKEG